MVPRLLAWTSLGATILFAILGITFVFAWESLGEAQARLVWYGAVSLLMLAILLAVAALIVAAFQADT
jgi:hypothetical protein